MSLAGCQINPIDVNFHLQKSLEIFDRNSADKIQSQNYKEVKVPCLMPISVKRRFIIKAAFSFCELSYDILRIKFIREKIQQRVALLKVLGYGM